MLIYCLILSIYVIRDVKSSVEATCQDQCILNSCQWCSHSITVLGRLLHGGSLFEILLFFKVNMYAI